MKIFTQYALLLIFLLLQAPALWAETARVAITIEGDPPIHIEADEIESDVARHTNAFIGRVTIKRGAESISADRAVWQDSANLVELSGAVKIENGEFMALAERAVVNLDLNLARIYQGRAFFPAQNYYLSGDLIERVGEKTIRIKNGRATTCDGPEPAWTISAEELTVTEGGYATAKGVAFNSKYLPLFYSPFFVFPVKNERQSGLLTPWLSNSSRDGFSTGVPFFWATGENHDLTFIPVWRDERGFSSTLEGRYRLSNGRGDWAVSYLNDHAPQYFTFDNNGETRSTRKRYWLRGQNNWRVGDWDVNLDVDLVSDPLYLAEFRNDIDGFMASRDMFSEDFGRTLNEYLDPLRTNTLYAQKIQYDSYFRGALTYTDNLYSFDNRDTIQRLPSLYHAIVARPILENEASDTSRSPVRFSMDTRYDYFYRTSDKNSETDEAGHRFQVKPSLSWSRSLADMATLSVTGDMNFMMYSADGYRPLYSGASDPRARHDSRYNRFEGEFEARLDATFSRVYTGGPGQAAATRHQMTPAVSFNYVETPDQDEMPYWDNYDRRLSRRTVRYGFLNSFVSKTPVTDEKGVSGHEYFQFLKVGLWASHEFADNQEWADKPQARYYTTDDYYDSGAGPLEVDIEAYFTPYVSARVLSALNGRTGQFTSHDISLNLTDPRGDSLSLTYDYDSPTHDAVNVRENREYNELRGNLNLKLNDAWSVGLYTRYDLKEARDLESYASLRYQAQCYAIGLMYSDNENDRRVGLLVDILGLGTNSGTSGRPQMP